MRIIFDESLRVRGLTESETVQYTLSTVNRPVSSSSVPGVFKDTNYSTVLTSVDGYFVDRTVEITGPEGISGMLVSDSPYVAEANGMTLQARKQGTVTARLLTAANGSRRIETSVSAQGITLTSEFTSFQAGSLAEHCYSQMTALVSGLSPEAATQTFWSSNNGNVASPNATMNAGLFAPFDFSGVSCCSTGRSDESRPATLISPRHALQAAHWTSAVGDYLAFKLPGGTYQIVQVSAIEVISSFAAGGDLALLYLSADVTGAAYYSVMPEGWDMQYAPCLWFWNEDTHEDFQVYGVPQIRLPIIRKAMHNNDGAWASWLQIDEILQHTAGGVPALDYNSIFGTELLLFPGWGASDTIPGDSTSPSWLIINGEPVLVSCQSSTSQTGNISEFVDVINAAMNSMAGTPQGTYVLQHPDLTSFTVYS